MLRMGCRPLGKGNTMDIRRNRRGETTRRWSLGIAAGLILGAQALASPGTENGAWTFIGGDSAHTRSTPADQINPSNLAEIEEAWVWDGASQRPERSLHADLRGRHSLHRRRSRRHVAMDPKNGETLVLPRTPHLPYEYSMRKDYGRAWPTPR